MNLAKCRSRRCPNERWFNQYNKIHSLFIMAGYGVQEQKILPLGKMSEGQMGKKTI
ncbi:MAG: hypothetical protein AB8B72_06380 [Crocinitomicaceae bacterium]